MCITFEETSVEEIQFGSKLTSKAWEYAVYHNHQTRAEFASAECVQQSNVHDTEYVVCPGQGDVVHDQGCNRLFVVIKHHAWANFPNEFAKGQHFANETANFWVLAYRKKIMRNWLMKFDFISWIQVSSI